MAEREKMSFNEQQIIQRNLDGDNNAFREWDFDFEFSEMDFEVPEFDIPDMDFDFDDERVMRIDSSRIMLVHSGGAQKLFTDLGEDEQIRIQAVRALDKKDAATTLPVLQKLLEREASPAIRHAAARKLRYFRDHEKSIDLLARLAQKAPNVQVRKAAITLLGESGGKKAKAILQDLAKE